MKAPAGELISLFSHKVHSFFRKALRVRNLSLHLFFKQTEDYRCFNDLIDQDRFEEIEGSVLGDSLLFRVTRQSHAAQVVPSRRHWLSGIDRVPRTSQQAPEGQFRYSHQGFRACVRTRSPRTREAAEKLKFLKGMAFRPYVIDLKIRPALAAEGRSLLAASAFSAASRSPGLAPGRSLGGYWGDGYWGWRWRWLSYASHTEPVRAASAHTAPTLV
jgi:hypothetical protein